MRIPFYLKDFRKAYAASNVNVERWNLCFTCKISLVFAFNCNDRYATLHMTGFNSDIKKLPTTQVII